MCGIAGYLQRFAESDGKAIVERMVNVLRHRGPDAYGVRQLGPMTLGHSRLALLDLTEAGVQPMTNEDQSVWLSFNGEIYNYDEIKKELIGCGHVFASRTDTEVVIHAYEQWGFACLDRIAGMFAFGLWDQKQERLWLVRDRLGIKPLFYAHVGGVWAFGSEIKALLQIPEIDSKSIDFEALGAYLALNYTPAPYTLFAQIRQLQPGHYLVIHNREETAEDVEYWDLAFTQGSGMTEKRWLSEFDSVMERTVRQHLVCDVPFGAFLSGGLDSSSLVWWMAQSCRHPVRSFSISFAEDGFDESRHADRVAGSVGSMHREYCVKPDAVSVLPKIVWHAEEPTADSSMLAVYYLSAMARRDVTMVFSGDGADEIFGGYETYPAYYVLKTFQAMPRMVRSLAERLAMRMFPVSHGKLGMDFKLRRFFAGAHMMPEDAHGFWRQIFTSEARQELLSPAVIAAGGGRDVVDMYRHWFTRCESSHPLNRMLYVDTRFYLPNDMLVKVDRMSMAHGLEARVPFLDHRLVEFAFRMPPSLKWRWGRRGKYALRKSMEGRLPRQILRRKKEGFNLPNNRWLRGELRDFAGDLLGRESLRRIGWFNAEYVQKLFKNHCDGVEDNSHQLWGLLSLVLWWRQFQEGSDRP